MTDALAAQLNNTKLGLVWRYPYAIAEHSLTLP